jgi:cell division control protein 6
MTLFNDKSALELDRLNVEVLGRSRQIKYLRGILSGIEQGFLPKLVSVYGLPGSGKTLVTRKVCQEYEKKFFDRFRFIYVNLGEAKTVFSCANKLLVAMGGVWRTGKSGLDLVVEEFWSKVLGWKGESPRFMLVALDEADNLFMDRRGNPSGFLYRLVRNEEKLEGSGIKLSLITISNQLITEIWELDARVRSSIGFEEVLFKPYTIQELHDILVERCKEAFNPDVVDPEVIKGCASYTGEESRDVRKMLEIMRFCGEVAEKENDEKV